MNYKLFVFIGLQLILKSVFSQSVYNVQFKQDNDKVVVTYYLNSPAKISLYISTNGGMTYRQCKKVTGAVGDYVSAGSNTIVWNALAEVERLSSDNVVFKVHVESLSKRERWLQPITFFTVNGAYSPAPQWSYGFSIGQVKRWGWYVTAMSNFQFHGLGHRIQPYTYYDLTGKSSTTRISLTAGVVLRTCNVLSLRLGAGFGYRTQSLNTTDGKWYTYPYRTFIGADAEFGMLWHIKYILLTTDITTINFKYIEGKIGVGFYLRHKKK